MKAVALLLLALAAVAIADSDVVDLTTDNFDSILKAADIALVEFFAPWCGHCKTLAPEYEKAATQLKTTSPSVVLAKVDATEQGELASKYGVSGYPTLKIFRNGVESAPYSGPRTADGIAKYMTKQAAPASLEITTDADLKKFLSTDDFSIVGFFSETSRGTALYKAFLASANTHREDFRYAHTFFTGLNGLTYSNDVIVFQPKLLQSKFEEAERSFMAAHHGKAEKINEKDINAFVTTVIPGLVAIYTPELKAKLPTPALVTYFNLDTAKNPSDFKYYRNRLLKLATQNNLVRFAVANKGSFAQEVKEFGLEGDVVAAIHGLNNEKYPLKGAWSVEAVQKLITDFNAGILESYIKSEPLPENDTPVKTLVGKNFKKIVGEPGKDLLIEFYAPWCGHCKTLAPKWDQLAEELKDRTDIVVAKIDATANDFPPYFKVSGYPTIYWVPAENKSNPVKYEGDREVKDFVAYAKKHATKQVSEGKKKSKKSKKEEL